MPRPKKCRRVEFLPAITVFKPAGVPRCNLEEVVLTVEELEALRLKDLEGLEQEECAERMQVSRPTFQRILTDARFKVASMLTRGLALRVEGGTYKLANRRLRCRRCHSEFEMSPDQVPPGGEAVLCPRCQDEARLRPSVPETRGKRGRRHRRGWEQHEREDNTESAPQEEESPDEER